MNRQMLEEAIVEAKTIKEAAIANAKSILEEAFTPTLMASFANQLNEMEFEEEEMMDGIDEMNDIDEMYDSVDEVDENFDLEEILRELESDNITDDDSTPPLDENLMLEKMDDDEIEELVMQTIKDMIKDGTIAKGPNADEDEDDNEEDIDFSDFDEEDIDDDGDKKEIKMDDEEEVSIDELLRELQFMNEDEDEDENPADNEDLKAAAKRNHDEYSIMKEELKTALKAVNELKTELNEVNLLNAKLLYTNKIFKAKNLTESEKVKVLNTFDKAETVKEVKLVFETLTESFKATAKKSPIKESLGSASKMIATAAPKQPIIEVNDAFARMQQLAGLRK
jgi:hypothetical protein